MFKMYCLKRPDVSNTKRGLLKSTILALTWIPIENIVFYFPMFVSCFTFLKKKLEYTTKYMRNKSFQLRLHVLPFSFFFYIHHVDGCERKKVQNRCINQTQQAIKLKCLNSRNETERTQNDGIRWISTVFFVTYNFVALKRFHVRLPKESLESQVGKQSFVFICLCIEVPQFSLSSETSDEIGTTHMMDVGCMCVYAPSYMFV